MKNTNIQFILVSIILLCFYTYSTNAQNPISPEGMYIADPEAHVWKDGKLYIYGSRDESDDYWCSYSHNVLSTSDLKQWHVVENAIASKGENDQIAYHDKLLFAPDCAYKDGKYYLYYCSPGKPKTEGVATSLSPYGPFKKGVQIKGAYQIDPAVLVDDDGQAYYYWGQGNPKVAKLKPNMIEIDESTTVKPLDKEGNIAFHEGSSIRKIGDLYYFVFADDSRENRPTCLGYAIGKSPMGPFEYKGVIIDNIGCDPSVWNNHGSIEQFNGQWYVFYHRSTHNSKKFRKACLEPITINTDGTIDEVEMTTQGAGNPISATSIMEARRACLLSGKVYIAQTPSTEMPTEYLTNIANGDYATYKYLTFEKKAENFQVKTSYAKGGTIEIRLDKPDGKKIGECIIPASEKSSYQISNCKIKKTKGKHALYLVFKGNGEKLFDVEWFQMW